MRVSSIIPVRMNALGSRIPFDRWYTLGAGEALEAGLEGADHRNLGVLCLRGHRRLHAELRQENALDVARGSHRLGEDVAVSLRLLLGEGEDVFGKQPDGDDLSA